MDADDIAIIADHKSHRWTQIPSQGCIGKNAKTIHLTEGTRYTFVQLCA